MFHRSQHTKEPIAIVGMSFRLPGGNNIDEFWEMMINGKEAIRPLPSFRWKREHITRQCTDRTVQGGFLSIPVDEFDAKFFGISPKEAEFLDPQQRLLHEVSWEALEDAQIDPHTLKGTQTGVFCGSWLHDYKDIALKSSDVEFFRVYMGNSLAPEVKKFINHLHYCKVTYLKKPISSISRPPDFPTFWRLRDLRLPRNLVALLQLSQFTWLAKVCKIMKPTWRWHVG